MIAVEGCPFEAYLEACRRIAELVVRARHCVVLTGAGISTESGIPDFRSPGTGLWTRMDPMELLSVTAFKTRPLEFYRFVSELVESFKRAEPNTAHRALAELERAGHVKAVVTQNIDGLHQRAGSVNVLEVHGNARNCTCTGCGRRTPIELALSSLKALHAPDHAAAPARTEKGPAPPLCDLCGSPLKPDIVLFEDPMPEDFVLAQQEALRSDFMIVIGSSLEVAPACYLPSLAQRLAIINLQPTPQDPRAEVVIRDKAGKTLQTILDIVLGLGAVQK